MSRVLAGLSTAGLLVLLGCAGRTSSDPSGAMAPAAVNGGASSTADACAAGAPNGGCVGEAGEAAERPLEPYAGLRTACRLSVSVNRRGAPVSVDYCIR